MCVYARHVNIKKPQQELEASNWTDEKNRSASTPIRVGDVHMSARRRYGGAGKNFSPESVTSESKNGPATLWLATSIVLFSSLNSYEDFSNAYDCELISFTDLCLFKAKPRESV